MSSDEEMTPTKTGTKAGEENSLHSSVVKNPLPKGGRAALGALRPHWHKSYGRGKGSRAADSMRSGEERAPTKTGAKDR